MIKKHTPLPPHITTAIKLYQQTGDIESLLKIQKYFNNIRRRELEGHPTSSSRGRVWGKELFNR